MPDSERSIADAFERQEEKRVVLAERLEILRDMSQRMAEDDGLWFIAVTASEAYLQQELRKLCAAIEHPLEDE